ncbi:MAG: tol-pal system YbgF family protein [Opitutales bacterium]
MNRLPLVMTVLVILLIAVWSAPFMMGQPAANEPTPEEFFQRMGERPIPVQLGNQRFTLLRRDQDRLVFQVPSNTAASFSRGIDDPNLALFLPEPPAFQQARTQARSGDYDKAVETLRPIAYPLVRYLAIPPEKFNIHGIVELFLESLINSGRTQEAKAILDRHRFDELPSRFAALGLDLAAAFVDQQNDDDALLLIDKVLNQTEGASEEYLPVFLRFTGKLRDSGQWSSAETLYNQIQQLGDAAVAKQAELWIIYISVRRAAEEDMALLPLSENLLAQLTGVEAATSEYALQRFVEGKIHAVRKEWSEALESFGEAVIYSEVSDSWTPELLYETGRAYRMTDRPEAARSVFEQNILFFRDNPWAQLSQQEADQLPAPETEAVSML